MTLNTITFDKRKITPSKIICIGRNYVAHIQELNNEIPDDMVIFLKPNSAISNKLSSIHQEQLHYEGELSFLYEGGKFVAVGFGLDLTKRQLQSQLKSKGLPWERAKSFDGSAVFSPFVELPTTSNSLSFELNINNDLVQTGNIDLMMYKPEQILKEVQKFISLSDGDIIMTGTPKGVGVIDSGDYFEAKITLDGQLLIQSDWTAD